MKNYLEMKRWNPKLKGSKMRINKMVESERIQKSTTKKWHKNEKVVKLKKKFSNNQKLFENEKEYYLNWKWLKLEKIKKKN